MSFENLPRAPITEAILDVRVRARSDVDVHEFRALSERIGNHFPKIGERRQFTTSFRLGPGGGGSEATDAPENRDLGVDGFFFSSADGLDVAQFRVDGFSLNRLRPYTGWAQWFPVFDRLWNLYREAAKPLSVVRLGARCINQFPVSREGVLEDYLTTPPRVPDGLPNKFTDFLTRVSTQTDGDPPLSLNLVQASQLAPDGRSVQILLDVDAFVNGEFDADATARMFEPLHELRNRAFFNSLTPQTIANFRASENQP
jgi:uncharacterized protein (TIGR04255 family)